MGSHPIERTAKEAFAFLLSEKYHEVFLSWSIFCYNFFPFRFAPLFLTFSSVSFYWWKHEQISLFFLITVFPSLIPNLVARFTYCRTHFNKIFPFLLPPTIFPLVSFHLSFIVFWPVLFSVKNLSSCLPSDYHFFPPLCLLSVSSWYCFSHLQSRRLFKWSPTSHLSSCICLTKTWLIPHLAQMGRHPDN